MIVFHVFLQVSYLCCIQVVLVTARVPSSRVYQEPHRYLLTKCLRSGVGLYYTTVKQLHTPPGTSTKKLWTSQTTSTQEVRLTRTTVQQKRQYGTVLQVQAKKVCSFSTEREENTTGVQRTRDVIQCGISTDIFDNWNKGGVIYF